MKKRSPLIIATVLAALVSLDAAAHSPLDRTKGGDLAQLVDQSNLVFLGRAEKVTYRNAPAENGEGPIPYTIVTYRIERALRGKAPGEQITMRFVGGPDGRGRFLTVSGVPVIQEGDRDLLFVGNPEDPSCPLVFCEFGRYRILKEEVFDTYGSPVREIAKAKVVARGAAPAELLTVRFPRPDFNELMKNPEVAEALKRQNMSADEARKRYEQEAPKVIQLTESFQEPEKSEDAGDKAGPAVRGEREVPMPIGRFVAAIEDLVTKSKRPAASIRSIDPAAPVKAARASRAVPKKLTPGKGPVLTKKDEEEHKALRQNDMNPVIRH